MPKPKVDIDDAALEKFVIDALESQPDLEYDIECPLCGKIITARLGENTCEHCGGSVTLGFDPPSDLE